MKTGIKMLFLLLVLQFVFISCSSSGGDNPIELVDINNTEELIDNNTSDTNNSIEPNATNYNIGHDWIAFEDSKRDNVIVTAELFYPSDVNGEKEDIKDEKFPFIIFAHGYDQVYSDYHDIWESLVPQGYIVIFLTTQQGSTIDIDDYAQDIVFLHDIFLHEDENYYSIVQGHTIQKSTLMGHSTGGGAIYLAQKLLPQTTTIVSLAALGELYGPITGSSPIDVAKSITIPSLVLAGQNDCITPVSENQQPIYNNLIGDKTIATILGGDHCGFSDSTNCPIAESLSCGLFSQKPTISEKQQIELTNQLILPWLDHYLKEKPDAWSRYILALNNNLIVYEMDYK